MRKAADSRRVRELQLANRSYLFSLSNQPRSHGDRPESISGLSEWAYDVPFTYRLLMSGAPRLCASLLSDGLGDDPPKQKTKLFAISSDFDPGLSRVKRFVDIALYMAVHAPLEGRVEPVRSSSPATLLGRLKKLFLPPQATLAAELNASQATLSELPRRLNESLAFLEAHRDSHLLLETIELDCMSEKGESALRTCVENEIARCLHAGAAVDALPADTADAAKLLGIAIRHKHAAPLDAFFGLHLDDDCDSTRDGATQYPLGLVWCEHLYFGLLNRSEYEKRDSQPVAEMKVSPMVVDVLARSQLFESYLGRQDNRMRFLSGQYGGPSNNDRLAYLAKDSQEVELFLGIKSTEANGDLQLDTNSLGGFTQFSDGWLRALIHQLGASSDTSQDAKIIEDAWVKGVLLTAVLAVRPGDSDAPLCLLRVETPPSNGY